MMISQNTTARCAKCNGTFWIITETGVARRCDCWEKERQNRTLKFASIPEKYKAATFQNFDIGVYANKGVAEKIKKMCEMYAEEFEPGNKGLYIHSQTKGSGKTRIAATICNKLIEKKVLVKFATSSSILEEIKKTWQKTSEYAESVLIDKLIMVDVLVIDDFGTEKPKDWINDKFYYIINERYINSKTTIYTSNYKLSELDYDDRITNRLKEVCYQIPFLEESIREKQATNNIEEFKTLYLNGNKGDWR